MTPVSFGTPPVQGRIDSIAAALVTSPLAELRLSHNLISGSFDGSGAAAVCGVVRQSLVVLAASHNAIGGQVPVCLLATGDVHLCRPSSEMNSARMLPIALSLPSPASAHMLVRAATGSVLSELALGKCTCMSAWSSHMSDLSTPTCAQVTFECLCTLQGATS